VTHPEIPQPSWIKAPVDDLSAEFEDTVQERKMMKLREDDFVSEYKSIADAFDRFFLVFSITLTVVSSAAILASPAQGK
jgi:hypothetical protein